MDLDTIHWTKWRPGVFFYFSWWLTVGTYKIFRKFSSQVLTRRNFVPYNWMLNPILCLVVLPVVCQQIFAILSSDGVEPCCHFVVCVGRLWFLVVERSKLFFFSAHLYRVSKLNNAWSAKPRLPRRCSRRVPSRVIRAYLSDFESFYTSV